jgi:hypothetical protein
VTQAGGTGATRLAGGGIHAACRFGFVGETGTFVAITIESQAWPMFMKGAGKGSVQRAHLRRGQRPVAAGAIPLALAATPVGGPAGERRLDLREGLGEGGLDGVVDSPAGEVGARRDKVDAHLAGRTAVGEAGDGDARLVDLAPGGDPGETVPDPAVGILRFGDSKVDGGDSHGGGKFGSGTPDCAGGDVLAPDFNFE